MDILPTQQKHKKSFADWGLGVGGGAALSLINYLTSIHITPTEGKNVYWNEICQTADVRSIVC